LIFSISLGIASLNETTSGGGGEDANKMSEEERTKSIRQLPRAHGVGVFKKGDTQSFFVFDKIFLIADSCLVYIVDFLGFHHH
jgi:hypothetical protein